MRTRQSIKPAPDAYRLALSRLRVGAADAVAIEDSPSGLAAAQGAGIRVVAVGHRRGPGEWSGTAAYVADLTDLARVRQMLDRDA